MNCPFLRETKVRFCQHAPSRKLIPRAADALSEERCSSASFAGCPIYRDHGEQQQSAPPCPYLHESLMQYCAASPVTRFVPYSEAMLSRCGSEAFHYCDLYLELTHAGWPTHPSDSIAVEPGLFYTNNHCWLDLPESGPCHIGIDAFLARLLGEVTHIDYGAQRGLVRPIALLKVDGASWQVAFPEKIQLTACNLYLRSDPQRLTAETYAQGWLFEGMVPAETAARLRAQLVTGDAAHAWMDSETRRLNEQIQQLNAVAADGGLFAPGLLSALDREDALVVFQEFCSPRYPEGRNA
jgi:glycine cleavage system H lipoate-binding protein